MEALGEILGPLLISLEEKGSLMKFRKEDLRELEYGDEPEGFSIVEDGDWSVDMKYQHRNIVFMFGGKYYLLVSTRSGSPFTDYTYESEWWDDEVECPEVEKVIVTRTKWKPVRPS